MWINTGLYEMGHVLLYVAFFGYSDLIIEEFNISTKEKKIVYYGVLVVLAIIMHYYYGKK